jgi:Phage major capsid protein E
VANQLQSLLGYVQLAGVIEAVKLGVPNPFPKEFFSIKKKTEGDSGRYSQITGTRRTARIVQYGATALQREQRNFATKDVKLIHSFEEQQYSPILLMQLRNYDNYEQMAMGKQEVTRQTKNFAELDQNLRISTLALALANGRVGFNGNDLVPDSSYSTATEQIDFGIAANNKNQLNGIIAAKWSLNNTDIPSQLRTLKQKSIQLTGYPITHAFYGINVPSYLTQNDYVLDYLARNPPERADFLNSAEVGELFGIKWHPVYTSFFEDSTGTNQTIFGADQVTFTPDIDESIYELMEGSYPVPRSINIATDAVAALNNFDKVYGSFAYGMVGANPPGIKQFQGDTFMTILKVPDAYFLATTVF